MLMQNHIRKYMVNRNILLYLLIKHKKFRYLSKEFFKYIRKSHSIKNILTFIQLL
jgi:hypothetical protein